MFYGKMLSTAEKLKHDIRVIINSCKHPPAFKVFPDILNDNGRLTLVPKRLWPRVFAIAV